MELRVTFTVEDDLNATEHRYDGINRRIRTIDAAGNEVEYVYDRNSNITATTETDRSQLATAPDEVIITLNTYDVLNRLTMTVDNIGNTDRFGYDSRDNQTVHEDAEGNTNLTEYDGANRQIATHAVMRADGTGATSIDTTQAGDGFISVFYTWDGNSRLQALTDDNGNRTIYTYDDLDRKTSATYGDIVTPPALADVQDPTTTEFWAYDRDHNITIFTDQNGSVHNYSYDGLNRKTQCDIAFASGNPHNLSGTTLQTHEYDGLSRKTKCTDNNQPETTDDDILCTYAYDTLSRKIEETCQIGSNPVRVTSYNFDESLARSGNLDPISMIYPDGREVEYSYDRINRMNGINDTGHSAIVTYDYIGRTPRVLQKSHQNGTLTTMQYDGIRRPTQLLTEDSSMNMITGFEHTYDAEDNKLNERKLHDPNNSELYAYDSAYRLTTFDRGTLNAGGTVLISPTATSGVLQLRDWTLDGLGNWSSNSSQNVGGALLAATRQHTNFNEIIEENPNVGDGVPPATFDHDQNGNLLTDDNLDFQWDALNRLRSVTSAIDGTTIATYTYDCQNRRMTKSLQPSASPPGSTTHFYYSGWRVCEEYTVSSGTESLKYQYVWGATYHDELITRDDRQGGTTVAQLNDGLGSDRQFQHHNSLFSVFAVTDESGTVLERYQYDPYGNQSVMDTSFNVLTNSAIEQELTYTGQRFDAETDQYYYKNRYYSSDQGRFISRDPIGYHDGMGLYEYAGSRSVNATDPMGENLKLVLVVIGGVAKWVWKKVITKKIPKPKKPPTKPGKPKKKCPPKNANHVYPLLELLATSFMYRLVAHMLE